MKNMKKILALLVAVLMIAASVSAFAADGEGTKSITLTGGKAGHTYTLYQIFTGKVENGEGHGLTEAIELTDIQWGADAPATYKDGFDTAAAAAKAAATQDDARAWAQSLGLTGDGSKQVTLNADGEVKFDKLVEGYYVILDTNGNTTPVEGDYSSAIIVAVVENVTGAIKGSATTSEKKVADTNDTEKVQVDLSGIQNADWADSADYDIGDYVPFKLTATLANNISSYRQYHVTFQDKQGAGLTMPETWNVSVLGKTFTLDADTTTATETTTNGTKITVSKGTPDSGNTFAIRVDLEQSNPTKDGEDITSYLNAESNGQTIVVTYQSRLTGDNVVIGKDGNPNEMYVQYSNNPENEDGGDEGKTPGDTVIVFTYKTIVDKVDETGEDLNGADFTLYKQVAESTTGATKGSDLTFGESIEHSAIKADKYYVVVGNKTGSVAGSQFEFKGIDDGTYVLVETTVPTGYNAWKSAEVTVTASHSDGDTPELTELKATAPFTVDNKEAGTVQRKKADKTHERVSGEAYAEIENKSGSTLPETGGIGTTLFYIGGGILVLAAVILLVTKRRMSAND